MSGKPPRNNIPVPSPIYLFLFLISFISWIIRLIFRPFKKLFKIYKKPFLSDKVKAKADWKYTKLLNKFRRIHHRQPTHDELFRIVINASHITIRRRGKGGHWGRQKVRKYLLEKNSIKDDYVMK